ncbi:MAG: hypothetical protein JXA77_09350 [Bacteroidales bacterium]|nr:hypothetical protein [Bacteroidales bacterium]MBN2817374.1 hypothetical protein [Bacteroidales bacterium]
MNKNRIVIWVSLLVLIAINAYFFKSFYDMQMAHQKNVLTKQTQVCTSEIEKVVSRFESDLNYILFSDDINNLFTQDDSDGLRKLQLFYSTYYELIKNIDIYDNNKNVLNIFRDKKKNFITDRYIAQRQRKLASEEEVLMQKSEYQYVLPVFQNNQIFANILVTININHFILSELEKFHLEGYTFQWVIDIENQQIFCTSDFEYKVFEGKEEIIDNLSRELGSIIIHKVSNDSVERKLLTVYAPITTINKDFGIAMSVDFKTCLLQIWNNLAIISVFSIIFFIAIALYLTRQITQLKKKMKE